MNPELKAYIERRATESGLELDVLGLDVETPEPIEGVVHVDYHEISTIIDGALEDDFVVCTIYEVNIADWIAEGLREDLNEAADWEIFVYPLTRHDGDPASYRLTSWGEGDSMIQISWSHEAAEASAFAALVPKALKSIDRWAETDGVQEMDEFGPYYDILIREGIKNPGNKRHHTLRPSTLRPGASKAMQDAPDHWVCWHNEIEEIFENLVDRHRMARIHNPINWSESTLDFMLQLAWFREVMFA